jgi:hypothetical protein
MREGSQIEFKEALPAKKDSDPWASGANYIGDHARNGRAPRPSRLMCNALDAVGIQMYWEQ